MKTSIADEVVVARLDIEAALTALASLMDRLRTMPRAEKVIVSETIREACSRLQAAQSRLAELEASPAASPEHEART